MSSTSSRSSRRSSRSSVGSKAAVAPPPSVHPPRPMTPCVTTISGNRSVSSVGATRPSATAAGWCHPLGGVIVAPPLPSRSLASPRRSSSRATTIMTTSPASLYPVVHDLTPFEYHARTSWSEITWTKGSVGETPTISSPPRSATPTTTSDGEDYRTRSSPFHPHAIVIPTNGTAFVSPRSHALQPAVSSVGLPPSFTALGQDDDPAVQVETIPSGSSATKSISSHASTGCHSHDALEYHRFVPWNDLDARDFRSGTSRRVLHPRRDPIGRIGLHRSSTSLHHHHRRLSSSSSLEPVLENVAGNKPHVERDDTEMSTFTFPSSASLLSAATHSSSESTSISSLWTMRSLVRVLTRKIDTTVPQKEEHSQSSQRMPLRSTGRTNEKLSKSPTHTRSTSDSCLGSLRNGSEAIEINHPVPPSSVSSSRRSRSMGSFEISRSSSGRTLPSNESPHPLPHRLATKSTSSTTSTSTPTLLGDYLQRHERKRHEPQRVLDHGPTPGPITMEKASSLSSLSRARNGHSLLDLSPSYQSAPSAMAPFSPTHQPLVSQERLQRRAARKSARRKRAYARFEDHYVLTRQILRCTQSSIWECVHRCSGQLFCVKLFDRRKWRGKSDSAPVHREIDFLTMAQGNERIIRFVEALEDRDKVYVVTEFVPTGNLLSRMIQDHQRGLPEAAVQELTQSLLEGVQYLHSKNIIHGDIEPSNLLVDTLSNQVKIVDFGHAIRADSSSTVSLFNPPSSASTVKISQDGKNIDYAAPEVLFCSNFHGGGGPTTQSDMWSVGVIVFFCLFGVPPFSSNLDTSTTIYHHDEDKESIEIRRIPRRRLSSRIQRADYCFPATDPDGPYCVSRQARQFISALIHADPQVRLTATEALAHPWLSPPEPPTPDASVTSSMISSRNPLRRLLDRRSNGNQRDSSAASASAAAVSTTTRPSVPAKATSRRRPYPPTRSFLLPPRITHAWQQLQYRLMHRLAADEDPDGHGHENDNDNIDYRDGGDHERLDFLATRPTGS